ncbi:glycosyltransferase family 39 protein [Patescibacteria group bacterium]|nr:glycosyltransferase family 39 protein [Patescibacteria group bacterium]MBU1473166.1 glycosyltransferase family 39 protein [Patescibacteria group bacterium]MBU2459774.1 glycosyltransferase family 39 protein [Patescibacteria group bacterium]
MKKLLILIIFLGAFLRYYELNWDSFHAFHPDERNIAWAVTRIRFFSQMNPKFFAYGGLPIYLYRALGEIVAAIAHNPAWLSDWGHIAVIGRFVSATLSSLSILLIYQVGTAFFSSSVGLLSAFLLAFSPWAIREAHFATTETSLVFFLLLILLESRYLASPQLSSQRGSPFRLGILLGLATAAKTTGALFTVIPFTAALHPVFRPIFQFSNFEISPHVRFFFKSLRRVIACYTKMVIAGGIVFMLLSPFTILDWQHFTESMKYESGVALGRFSVPYTLQFLGTVPYFYQLKTMLWQAGPVAILGMFGLLVLLLRAGRSPRHAALIVFLVFPIIYFLWTGSWFAKFARYNVPLLPFLTIAASWLLITIYKKFRLTGLACVACTACVATLWGLANWTIYLRPQTRIAASEWIYTNIPAGSLIYTEHWNDGLPVFLPGDPVIAYKRELLNVYDADTEEKKKTIIKQLERGDYVILSTRRIWGTMPKLTDRYPFTSELYRKLLNGESEYKEVATFTSYPQLFSITINDDAAEESIQVFDHPAVRIFQNTKAR